VEFLPKIKEKRWDKKVETIILSEWRRKKLYSFNKKAKGEVFAIDTPPPYVNKPIHVGHAYTYVIMDIIARFRRMTGWNVLFPLGLDKNGLPIEVQAEKKYGISMHETPREDFIKKCKKMIEESGDASIQSFHQLGISFNEWKKKYEIGGRYDTDDKEYRRMTQETFIRLWDKGLIYEDDKPTNYCTVCHTTISDAEVEYEEHQTQLNYIRFSVKETATAMAECITIATTRPELLCACKLILYNPEDVRYMHLEGRTATVPLYNKEIPIMPHPSAKSDFGTGLVMICSFGDYTDVRILREMDITPTYAIDEHGKMTRAAKRYRGMTVKDAREAIIHDLKRMKLIEKEEPMMHRQPMCWRSKTPIEFVPMKEFYLKQVEFKEDILKIANSIDFYTPESKQILIDWINSINIDWVISRRRYYGTEVPLWHCKNCKTTIVPPAGKYYRPWKQSSPIKRCPKCDSRRMIGEIRTFDTWFDSSSSEYFILGYLWDKKFWKKNMPCTLRPQGKEIVRTWLYFTLLKAYLLDDMQAFKNCWIHMHVIDDKGEKMSKSVGNVVDPQEILKKYGADAFRIWTCFEGDISKGDVRCSFERIEGTSKFLTKLWNISRFISMFPQPEKKEMKSIKLEASDKWILAELSRLVNFVKEKYEAYEFNAAALAIRDFTWNILAAHYIEMVKPRAYAASIANTKSIKNPKNKEEKKAVASAKAAWHTLHKCLDTLLHITSPIIPFATDHIWVQLYTKNKKDSIHGQKWPSLREADKKMLKQTKKLIEFNSMVWNTKKEQSLSLRDPIDIKVPKALKPFEYDLTQMHNFGKKRIEPKPAEPEIIEQPKQKPKQSKAVVKLVKKTPVVKPKKTSEKKPKAKPKMSKKKPKKLTKKVVVKKKIVQKKPKAKPIKRNPVKKKPVVKPKIKPRKKKPKPAKMRRIQI